MKTVGDIIDFIQPLEVVHASENAEVKNLSSDSRDDLAGCMFVALQGLTVDGHQYIENAIQNGAKFILIDKDLDTYHSEISYLRVENTNAILADLCGFFYDYPDREMQLIGITGTNGKTSTAHYIYQLLSNLGHTVGLISTTDVWFGKEIKEPAERTTPDIISLYRIFDKMRRHHCGYVVMEVSSHAIDQGRVEGISFTQGIFTNISHDHLDYHGSMSAYIAAKKKFFDTLPKTATAIVNIDDANGSIMVQNTSAVVKTYALNHMADYHIKILEVSDHYQFIRFNNQDIYLPLLGRFNLYNAGAAMASAIELGMEENDVLAQASLLHPVEGRMQLIISPTNHIRAVVDYAHTPDALKNVLMTIREQISSDQRLICVVGCGGDRDKEKRPKMARIGFDNSDQLILTSDNPRSEDPDKILEDMLEGLSKEEQDETLVITNREEAIKMACKLARDFDFVLIAGKGHEKYQEINGVKYPFSDQEHILRYLN